MYYNLDSLWFAFGVVSDDDGGDDNKVYTTYLSNRWRRLRDGNCFANATTTEKATATPRVKATSTLKSEGVGVNVDVNIHLHAMNV